MDMFCSTRVGVAHASVSRGGKVWNSVDTTACMTGRISCSNIEMPILNARDPFTGKLTAKEQQQKNDKHKKNPSVFSLIRLFKYVLVTSWVLQP